MTLLAVVKDVCAEVGVIIPTSVFSGLNTNRTMQEMLALANEMAQRIAHDTRDWTELKRISQHDGDGIKTAFPIPADYKRMLKSAEVWRSDNPSTPMRFIPDTNEWLVRRLRNNVDGHGEWTIIGGHILIFPAMPVGVYATYAYLNRNPVDLLSGGQGERFMDDGDSFSLGDRLLKLGMVWQWKANKGSPYAEEMATYNDALANDSGSDSPAPTFVGRTVISANARVSYPWPLPS